MGEIGRGIHQLVCASSFKFVSGTITPEHAKTTHSHRMGAGNIIPAIPVANFRWSRMRLAKIVLFDVAR